MIRYDAIGDTCHLVNSDNMAQTKAYTAKPSEQCKLLDPIYTREQVIQHILDAKDWDLVVENSELHLPLVSVSNQGILFQRTFCFVQRDRKKKPMRKDYYQVSVTVPLMLGFPTDKPVTHVWLRAYASEWNHLIDVQHTQTFDIQEWESSK